MREGQAVRDVKRTQAASVATVIWNHMAARRS